MCVFMIYIYTFLLEFEMDLWFLKKKEKERVVIIWLVLCGCMRIIDDIVVDDEKYDG